MKTALFHRQFTRYSGGHQKVLDYFEHFQAHVAWEASIAWAAGSLPMGETIWAPQAANRVDRYTPAEADLVFIAGMDWQAYLPVKSDQAPPIVNLVQHVRHADPDADVYPFLEQHAIRICVSREVEAAILDTGRVNGPTFTIANGVNVESLLSRRRAARGSDVYILGSKSGELARGLATSLEQHGLKVTTHAEFTARDQVLDAMASASVAVLLPHPSEGFYLPALEAMALNELVVVPDCVGNRSFCAHQENCLMPGYTLDELAAATLDALAMVKTGRSGRFREAAASTLNQHRLERERADFYRLLDQLDALW